MSRKKQDTMEFRYYDIPSREFAMALQGEEWYREYGEGVVKLHFHNLMEIGCCKYGYGILRLDDRKLPYGPGMISIIPKNYPHTTNSEEGTCSYWEFVFLDPESILRTVFPNNPVQQNRLLKLLNANAYFGRYDQYASVARLADQILKEMWLKGPFYTEVVRNLTSALLFEIARIGSAGPDNTSAIPASADAKDSNQLDISVIGKALEYISRNYKEQIRIEQLAAVCSLSETHFRRLFREYLKMTPVEYINMVRIQMACDLLKKTNDPIDTVALKSGFTNASSFNRNFKQMIGATPYKWKNHPENYESRLLQFHISAEKGW